MMARPELSTKADVLLIGSGSIAVRHATVVRAVLPGARITLLRLGGRQVANQAIELLVDRIALGWDEAWSPKPTMAIVANAASGHVAVVETLLSREVPILVEKPIGVDFSKDLDLLGQFVWGKSPVLVGYVLRHHPLVRLARDHVSSGAIGEVIHFRGAVGQHLSSWRPDQKVKDTVSARAELGGGALLELSHEIDLALAFHGPATAVNSQLVAGTTLGIGVEVLASILMRHNAGTSSNLHMDMIDRISHRMFTVTGSQGSVEVDLLRGIATLASGDESYEVRTEQTDIFRVQFEHFLECVAETSEPMTTVSDAMAVLRVCRAARRSAVSQRWEET